MEEPVHIMVNQKMKKAYGPEAPTASKAPPVSPTWTQSPPKGPMSSLNSTTSWDQYLEVSVGDIQD